MAYRAVRVAVTQEEGLVFVTGRQFILLILQMDRGEDLPRGKVRSLAAGPAAGESVSTGRRPDKIGRRTDRPRYRLQLFRTLQSGWIECDWRREAEIDLLKQ